MKSLSRVGVLYSVWSHPYVTIFQWIISKSGVTFQSKISFIWQHLYWYRYMNQDRWCWGICKVMNNLVAKSQPCLYDEILSCLLGVSVVHVLIGYIIRRWKVAITLLGNSYLHLTIISCTHFPFFWACFVVQYSLSVSIVVSTQRKCKNTMTSAWWSWDLQ